MSRPLDGVGVLELAHVMAGPVCGLMLADLGADVVKVERLPGGDNSRAFVPPELDGESAAFMMLNRGKRGIALDLRRPEGVEVVRRLAAGADVLIENFRLGTMERMGLGWDGLARANPRLVYCQITGFGRTGPLAEAGGFDLIAQGYSGLMGITGEAPGRDPVKVGAPVTDITAGILGALGVTAALFERERTDHGQLVDTSLLEAGITQTYWQSAIALATGRSPGAMGSSHPLSAPYQAFRTADGWLNVGASNAATWLRLTRAIDRPELAEDPRYATNADRMARLDELCEDLSAVFVARGTGDWLDLLGAAGVPVGPVASIGEMLDHAQTLAREMVIDVRHSRLGTMRSLGSPLKLSGSTTAAAAAPLSHAPEDSAAPSPGRGAPQLGEHTREVLLERGWTGAEVDALVARGVAVALR
jgi:crotonobetainyl-CoA:carnitine CoA-transferase CaiB-like acyl-CoA transferase